MKICLVYSPKLDIGGVERHLLDLISFLCSQDNEIILLSSTSEVFLRQLNSLIQNKVLVIPWKSTKDLDSLVETLQPDILHFHSPDALLKFYNIKPGYPDIPIIETRHLSYPEFFAGDQKTLWRKFRGAYYRKQERKINHKFVTKCVFVSQVAYRRAISSGDIPLARAAHIPNAVNFSKTKNNVKQIESRHDPVLICTSRLEEQKGHKYLLRALKDIYLPWELWLVGSGSQEAELKKQVNKFQLKKKIRFWGHIENIWSLLSQADIFLLPSLSEASPYGLLEAMASGLPCIVSSVGDIGEWVQPGENGLLVPPGDVLALSTAIRNLLEAPNLWKDLGSKAAESIRNHHNPDNVFTILLEEYNKAIVLLCKEAYKKGEE